jgi:DNA-binding LytR/AlgR family response regulator
MHLPESIKLLLVDNNTIFLQVLQLMLTDMRLNQVATAIDAASGLEAFRAFEPNLCLLDVKLGQTLRAGIALGEKIRLLAPQVPIIFMSDFCEPDCYERCRHVLPSGFISKDISRHKLYQALDLALLQQQFQQQSEKSDDGQLSGSPLKKIFFKVGDVFKSIPIEQVTFFYADNKLTFARVGQRSYPSSVQLKTLERELSPLFARTHKSYLVNTSLIESINPKEGTVSLAGETLPIGYAYRHEFLEGLKLLR